MDLRHNKDDRAIGVDAERSKERRIRRARRAMCRADAARIISVRPASSGMLQRVHAGVIGDGNDGVAGAGAFRNASLRYMSIEVGSS